MLDIVKGIIFESFNLFNEMSPYLMLGFIFAGILHVFISIETIGKHLGKNNFMSVLKAVVFGIPLPLCSCGVIPAAVLLRRNGASRGSVVSFLIATPITGIDSIFATYSLFGILFTIYRVIASSITAIIAGIISNLMNYGEKDGHLTSEETKGTECPHCSGENKEKENEKPKLISFFHYTFIKSINDIWKWLVLGTLIGGVIAYAVPESFIQRYIGSDLLAMFIMLIAGIPMYVCSTGSIPIAASLLMKGMSPGAALVFLLAGPATNAVTITVVAKELGKKAMFIYVFVIAAMSILMGMLINMLPGMDFSSILTHSHSQFLPKWLHYSSSILLGILILVSLIKGFLRSNNEKQ